MDLCVRGYKVYVIVDGVSSCNKVEVGVVLDRLRGEEGIRVMFSESWMYEVVGDVNYLVFKILFGVVKGFMVDIWKVFEVLLLGFKI